MRLTSEEKKRQQRMIYQLLCKDPWILPTMISKALGIGSGVARNRMNDAFEKGRISKPNIRKKSFSIFKEYMYFVRCKDPLELYLEYSEDERITYHAVMDEFANLWVISKEEIDIDGNVLLWGPRSDYHVAFAPDHTWKTSIKNIEERIEKFDLDEYRPKGIIQTHWDERIEWDAIDEILYRYFKYNLRKALTPLKREYLIVTQKFKNWLKKLPECCNIMVRYYPEKRSSYDPYIFVFETDYEDFVIDLFSELPTSSTFFKVSDKLILYAYVERKSVRDDDIQPISDVSELHIPLLMRKLLKKGIIKSKAHATVNYHWGKSI